VHIPEPTLSVICVFRNRREWVEPTLKALYSIKRIPCEFIIIDDASTDDTTEAIRSIIEYYQHDQTYFFEQEAPRGRGNSLSSAMEQVRGRVLWIPENLHSVDQDWLAESIESLTSANAHTAIAMEDPVPKSPMDWLHLLQNERVPYDRNYLFDFGRMRSIRKFTDPHWSTRHATELAIRLMADSDPIPAKPFAKGETRRMDMDDRSKKECVLAMLRIPELSLSGQEKAFRMLRSFGHTDTEEDEGSAEPLYQEAQALYKSGNSVAALEILNRILAAEPDHRRARIFKIQILEKMRRYVEAAELKHGYDLGKATGEPETEKPTPDTDDQEAASPSQVPETEDHAEEDEEDSVTMAPEGDDPMEMVPEEPESRNLPADDETGGEDPEDDGFFIDLSDTGPAVEREEDKDQTPEEGEEPDKAEPVTEAEAEAEADTTAQQKSETETEEEAEPVTETQTGAHAGSRTQEEPEAAETDTGDREKTGLEEEKEKVKPISVFGDELRGQPELTIIIPTATVQRPVLEDCLTSVFRQTSSDRTRVIVIDNGSVDDTSVYLQQPDEGAPQASPPQERAEHRASPAP
jgi:hypothetical protein